MSTVVMHNVVSLDGFVADLQDDPGPCSTGTSTGTGPSARRTWRTRLRVAYGCRGRHLFDLTNGWEGRPPTGEHVVVVSHRQRPDGWHPEASATSAPSGRSTCSTTHTWSSRATACSTSGSACGA